MGYDYYTYMYMYMYRYIDITRRPPSKKTQIRMDIFYFILFLFA